MRGIAMIAAAAASGAGCRSAWLEPDECKAYVADLERRVAATVRAGDALEAVDLGPGVWDEARQEHVPAIDLPRAAAVAWPFDPGLALWLDHDHGAVPEAVVPALAATACARGRAEPLVVHLLVERGAHVEALGRTVAELDAASAAWNVPVDLRLVVRAPETVLRADWPPGTPDDVKRFAQEMLSDDRGRDFDDPAHPLKRLTTRIVAAGKTCPAIARRGAELVDSRERDPRFGLPEGLAECQCRYVDVGEVAGLYHIHDLIRTDLGWIRVTTRDPGVPLATGARTAGELVDGIAVDRAASYRIPPVASSSPEPPPLACQDPEVRTPVMIRGTQRAAGELPPALVEAIDQREAIAACRASLGDAATGQTAPVAIRIVIAAGKDGELEISASSTDDSGFAWGLAQCLRQGRMIFGDDVVASVDLTYLVPPAPL